MIVNSSKDIWKWSNSSNYDYQSISVATPDVNAMIALDEDQSIIVTTSVNKRFDSPQNMTEVYLAVTGDKRSIVYSKDLELGENLISVSDWLNFESSSFGVKKTVEKTIFASFNKLIRKLEIPDVFEVQFGLYVSGTDKIIAKNHCQMQCKISIIGVEVTGNIRGETRLVKVKIKFDLQGWRSLNGYLTRTMPEWNHMIKQFEGEINVRESTVTRQNIVRRKAYSNATVRVGKYKINKDGTVDRIKSMKKTEDKQANSIVETRHSKPVLKFCKLKSPGCVNSFMSTYAGKFPVCDNCKKNQLSCFYCGNGFYSPGYRGDNPVCKKCRN